VSETPKKRAPRATTKTPTDSVLAEVKAERKAQDERFGVQDHPLIGGPFVPAQRNAYAGHAAEWKRINDTRVRRNQLGMDGIALEEVFELFESTTLEHARGEAVQLAAVAVMIVESIDRKLAGRSDA